MVVSNYHKNYYIYWKVVFIITAKNKHSIIWMRYKLYDIFFMLSNVRMWFTKLILNKRPLRLTILISELVNHII